MSNHHFQFPVLSFPPSGNDQNYELSPIDTNLKTKLRKFVLSVQHSKKHHLLYRGDSIPDENYKLFISNNLSRFFIVGKKARSNVNKVDSIFLPYDSDKSELLNEIKELIVLCNAELKKHKSRRYSTVIDGLIPDSIFEELNNSELSKIRYLKLLLLSFLHNKGEDNYYKDKSPFLSLTTKFKTAITFASRGENKIVFLYILNNSNRYYYTARKLRNTLKKDFDISWYKDIHSEFLILGAMYPDRLIGFYEIKEESPIKFILNPWVKKHLEINNYDNIDDIDVEQRLFFEYAEDLGYTSFVQRPHEDGSTQWIAEINDYQNQKLSYRF